jgi:signal transduction histidine kinase
MKNELNRRTSAHQIRYLVLTFLALAVIMVASALFELYQSRRELQQLMTEQTHALLNTLLTASKNTLRTNAYLEDLAKNRLLNNASLIKDLFESGQLSNDKLLEIGERNDLYRINIFDRKGHKLFSSHEQVHQDLTDDQSPQQILQPILSGQTDSIIIGYKAARHEGGYRYAVALATRECGAIVINVDARQLLEFKRTIGFGALLRNMVVENPAIVYAALQDTSAILAASGNVKALENALQSDFLMKALVDSMFMTRTVEFDTLQVFEAVHPFEYEGHVAGLLRLGMSLEPLRHINARIYTRLALITIILVIIGFVVFTYILIRQKYDILQRRHEVVETYSAEIIGNVSDAIIVNNTKQGVTIFNEAAERLFSRNASDMFGQSIEILFPATRFSAIYEQQSYVGQITYSPGEQTKSLLISKSQFTDSDGNENLILVIRDLTEQKFLQEQMERKQRLSAMGELASGVAHEIRNPLNTIGTIVQQLDKDFEPQKDNVEYHSLAKLVYSEVRRINDTVQDFLRFSRPEPVQPVEFSLEELFGHLATQYKAELAKRSIRLDVHLNWKGQVTWDRNQMKQALINLLQNAMEAIGEQGIITIQVNRKNDESLLLRIEDSGPGMTDKVREKIFNLYYTTKAKGTGIGLSIVQRIILEHDGVIHVESQPGQGAVFTINIPTHVQK